MPPKKTTSGGPSNKTVKKAKEKYVEEHTFGLKNKSKSKKVQKESAELKKNVMGVPKRGVVDPKEERKLKKLAERQREAELKALFNVVPSKEELARKEEEKLRAEQAGDEDEDAEEDIKEEDALAMLGEIEEELREEEEMSLEEVIEKERAKITNGTPVTLESFKKWKTFKNEQRAKEEERIRKLQEAAYKKGGHGISGRLLFELDQSVFVDDVEASDKIEREEIPDEEIDTDLFLEGEDGEEGAAAAEDGDAKEEDGEDGEEEEKVVEEESYDEATWKDKANPPKALLQAYMYKNKIKQMPVYEGVDMGGMGFRVKCKLPHLDNKEFYPLKVYNSKKLGENNAAMFALQFLENAAKQEQPAASTDQPAE